MAIDLNILHMQGNACHKLVGVTIEDLFMSYHTLLSMFYKSVDKQYNTKTYFRPAKKFKLSELL